MKTTKGTAPKAALTHAELVDLFPVLKGERAGFQPCDVPHLIDDSAFLSACSMRGSGAHKCAHFVLSLIGYHTDQKPPTLSTIMHSVDSTHKRALKKAFAAVIERGNDLRDKPAPIMKPLDPFDLQAMGRFHRDGKKIPMWTLDNEDRLIARYPEPAPAVNPIEPSTLAIFESLIAVLSEGPADKASARYGSRLLQLAEDATQAIKRERTFAEHANTEALNRAEQLGREKGHGERLQVALERHASIIRTIAGKCPIHLDETKAYHSISLSADEIAYIKKLAE